MATSTPTPYFTDKLYNQLKFIAQIFLPALGALYFGLAQIWDLPKAEEVVGSITVIDTFLGVLLGLSTNAYNNSDARYDGQLQVVETANAKTFTLNLNSEPEALADKPSVEFKVEKIEEV